MSIPKILDFSNYNHYPTDSNPTTDADMQDYMSNQNSVLQNVTSAFLWQPQTAYVASQEIHSPNLPAGYMARCVTAGTSGTSEPSWASGTLAYTDGTVTWNIVSIYTEIAQNKSNITTLSNNKANSSDVYTKADTNTLLDKKANSSNTLEGYGITDVYTKDNILNGVNQSPEPTLANMSWTDQSNKYSIYLSETFTCKVGEYIEILNTKVVNYVIISLKSSSSSVTLSKGRYTFATKESVTIKVVFTTYNITQDSIPNYIKLDCNPELYGMNNIDYIVDSGESTDGTMWYRKWKSGWLEQGGTIQSSAEANNIQVTFIEKYADDDKIIVTAQIKASIAFVGSTTSGMSLNGVAVRYGGVNRVTTTGFYFNRLSNNDTNTGIGPAMWYACGQGA